nr:helix-turn-helix transcriptional regulator [Bacteroidota bacterium]
MLLLGKQIALLRKQQNLTQAQLAFEIEISREQLVRIEKGKYNKTFYTLYKLSFALEISFEVLTVFINMEI